jgi:hypothetical protein
LQEGRSSTFSWLQEIENAGRLNKEIENMKRRAKLGSAEQTSRSDNQQIHCSTEELAAEVILRKLSRIWGKSLFEELVTRTEREEPLTGTGRDSQWWDENKGEREWMGEWVSERERERERERRQCYW